MKLTADFTPLVAWFRSVTRPLRRWSSSTIPHNPYVKGAEGQTAWNDRYANLAQHSQQWRRAFFAALVMCAGLAGVVATLATSTKVQPFVVETHDGIPYAIAPMPSLSRHDQRLINFALNQFIIHARTVVNDPVAEKALLDQVYAYAANQTLSTLQVYYQQHNPFELAAEATVTVAIVNVLPLSRDTWQITWDETRHATVGGQTLEVTRWMANLTVQWGDVNPHRITQNPFGLYITQLRWSPTIEVNTDETFNHP